MRLDFICPGLPKCATTTLDIILRQYEEICLPCIKEPVFLQSMATCRGGVEWYAKKYFAIDYLNKQKEGIKYGEINPSFGCSSSRRLRDVFGPGVKILIILRNPVKRAWSNFNHCINEGEPIMLDKAKNDQYLEKQERTEIFDEFLKDNFVKENGQWIYTGTYNCFLTGMRYSYFINQYLKFFARDQIKVCLFEEFISEPERICKEIVEFLGISFKKNLNYQIKENAGDHAPADEASKYMIEQYNQILAQIKKDGSDSKKSGETYERLFKEREKFFKPFTNGNMSAFADDLLRNYLYSDKLYAEEIFQKDLTDIWY